MELRSIVEGDRLELVMLCEYDINECAYDIFIRSILEVYYSIES